MSNGAQASTISAPDRHQALIIEQAEDEESRHLAYALRYRIYVEQMRRTQKYADHHARIVREPMDERGTIYIARSGREVVGTIRGNRLSDPATAYYREFYRAELFAGVDLADIDIFTKLMVLPELRSTTVGVRLIQSLARNEFLSGVKIVIIDCNHHLISFFERLGCFSYIGWADHLEYGRVRPMFFAPDAVDHLRRMKSVLHPVVAPILQDDQYGGYELIRRLAMEPMSNAGKAQWAALFDTAPSNHR